MHRRHRPLDRHRRGLGLALKRMAASDAPARVIVLLSDGRDTAQPAGRHAGRSSGRRHGVRVHTIALGPQDLETRPADRDAVDTAALRRIAEASGGVSYRVRGMADLVAMAADLDRLEPNPSERPPVLVARPLWMWPATLGGLAAVCLGLLPLWTGRRREGQWTALAWRRGAAVERATL